MSLMVLRGCFEEAREESKIYKNFCNKDQVIRTLGFPGGASGEEPPVQEM